MRIFLQQFCEFSAILLFNIYKILEFNSTSDFERKNSASFFGSTKKMKFQKIWKKNNIQESCNFAPDTTQSFRLTLYILKLHPGPPWRVFSSFLILNKKLSSKTGLIFYLADFHGRNCRIPGSYENKTQQSTLSPFLY